jgi:tricarballylate dehydrogenase
VRESGNRADIVVVGCGAAGTSALLSAVETSVTLGLHASIIGLEASNRENWGGSSRWTGAYLRMVAPDEISPNFVEDFIKVSSGKLDEDVIKTLAGGAAETVEWVRSKGVEFERRVANVASGSSIHPVGNGLAIISALRAEAEKKGAKILFETRAVRLTLTREGAIDAVWVHRGRHLLKIRCKAVILASGGFAGSPTLLAQNVGKWASTLSVAAPGTKICKGDGIRMALAIGAKPSGQYDSFQAKVVDARSKMFDAYLQILQFGILVNQRAERFVEERETNDGEISDLFNHFGKRIAKQPGQIAYLILDQNMFSAIYNNPRPQQQSLVLSDIPPICAQSLDELAMIIKVPKKKLAKTVMEFNSRMGQEVSDSSTTDFKSMTEIANSYRVAKIDRPPFICYSVRCAIQFTFGGISIDSQSHVVSESGKPIPGLYAAGEVVGLHYGRYLPGALVLSALVFGRKAGCNAVEYVFKS